jgi:hypothetical protein
MVPTHPPANKPIRRGRPSFVTCMNLGVNVINREMMAAPPAPSYEEQVVRSRLGLTDHHRYNHSRLEAFLQSPELGLPNPFTRRLVCPPPPFGSGGGGGGRAHSLAGEGVPIPTRGHRLWYSIYIN